MSWTPVHPLHAIERVRFLAKFREPIPSKLSRQMGDQVSRVRHELRFEGPLPVSAMNFAVHVTPSGEQVVSPQASLPQGWQFNRKSSAGETIELINVAGDTVTYETTEYRGWDTYKRRFERFVSEVMTLGANTLDLDTMSLEYLDRFIFQGEPNVAAPSELLEGVASFLSADALSGKSLWHVHRGWFQDEEGGSVLFNQNFDAMDVSLQGKGRLHRSITILNKVELRGTVFPALEKSPLSSHLELMHRLSKALFATAVVPEMLKTVGISQELK